MGDKNPATGSAGGIKIIDLGKELNVDPRQIVAAAKDAGMEHAKVPASWVTHGQAERLRAKFGGQKHLKAALERRQRAKEESLSPTPAEAQPVTTPLKLGKKSFEADRRSIFGVAQTPGGVRMESRAHDRTDAKPAVTGITPPKPAAQDSSDSAQPSEFALPPPTKVLEIKVAPPVRREPGERDTRFGVVKSAQEAEAPAAEKAAEAKNTSNMWGKLDDGREHPEFAAAEAAKEIAPEPEPSPPAGEEKTAPAVAKAEPAPSEIPEAQEIVAKPVAEPPAPVVEHKPAAEHKPAHAAAHAPFKRTVADVPVKIQPGHKAFGAKHKVKAKKHKLLKAAESGRHERPNKPKEKHAAKATAPAAHEPKHKPAAHAGHGHAHAKEPGLLQRLVRKLFKK